MKPKQARFKVFHGRKGWFFHLRAKNGKIVLASESYTTQRACVKTVKTIQKIAADAAVNIDGFDNPEHTAGGGLG